MDAYKNSFVYCENDCSESLTQVRVLECGWDTKASSVTCRSLHHVMRFSHQRQKMRREVKQIERRRARQQKVALQHRHLVSLLSNKVIQFRTVNVVCTETNLLFSVWLQVLSSDVGARQCCFLYISRLHYKTVCFYVFVYSLISPSVSHV